MESLATYSSRDIYVASILLASGIKLVRVENHQGKGFFIFENSPKIEGLLARYHNGELRLNAKSLFSCWKDLKSLAFSAVSREGLR